MRASILQNLREKAASHGRHSTAPTSWTITTKRSKHSVAVQLDYYMSPQFAGVASAVVNGLYSSQGLDVKFLPTCDVGLELERVRQFQDANPSTVVLGVADQNTFVQTLYGNPGLSVTAAAAMFYQTPLCVVSTKIMPLGGQLELMKIPSS